MVLILSRLCLTYVLHLLFLKSAIARLQFHYQPDILVIPLNFTFSKTEITLCERETNFIALTEDTFLWLYFLMIANILLLWLIFTSISWMFKVRCSKKKTNVKVVDWLWISKFHWKGFNTGLFIFINTLFRTSSITVSILVNYAHEFIFKHTENLTSP